MRTPIVAGGCLLLVLAVAASGKDEVDSSLENGSFEAVVAARPTTDTGQGGWGFGPDHRMPAGWSLNAGYPGTLTVVDTGAAAGGRCIRVTAGSARDAQLHRTCAALRPGHWFRVSASVRGGSASVLVYEYDRDGTVRAHTLASGSGPNDTWRRVVGFYAPSTSEFKSASVALLVPKGTSALLDDVRVERMEDSAAGARAPTLRLANKEVELRISGMGRLESLVAKGTKQDHAAPSAPTPVLSATRDGVRIPVASLTKRGETWTARFADPAVVVKLRVRTRDRYFLFEVTGAKPDDLDALELRFPVRPLGVRDAWMPGTYDDAFGVCLMGVTANTEVSLGPYGASVAPESRWVRRHGIEGGRAALVATEAGRFLDTIRRMEADTGLPSPMLRSGAPGETGTSDWARRSPAVRRSYLFSTYLGPNDVDALIRHAKAGGFGLIMLHRLSWRASAGHETIARDAFPAGLPDLVKACEKIRAAGLGVGLHLFGPSVSLNDAYVTPVPDPRLFTLDVAPLAARVDATATELVLAEQPALPRKASPGVYPGDLLRIGDEIVRWRELVPGTPCRLVGCERGAAGTTAAAHRAGTDVRSFVLATGQVLVDPDSTLPDEMGAHLARVVNATQADLVYFDAIGAAPPGKQPDRWYYVNRTLLASCAKFDHGVLVQTALGPGRQLPWHLVPRSASADGHGDLKGYLDQRLPGIRQMRRTGTAADIGWYALDVHGRPDELEYVCAKALATDASISVQANRPLLESHPRAREVFEMIERWERRRLAEDVPVGTRELLGTPGRDFRLLEAEGGWSLWEAEYEPERPILALDGSANRWNLVNERAEPVHVALEIRRATIATTPAAHGGPDAIPVIDLADLTGFGDPEDPRLLAYAQAGERRLNAEGLSRRGVVAGLAAATDAPTGEPGALFSANNTIHGAGWCVTGRTLAEPLDLSRAKALGFWVRGDGHGETLVVMLGDTSERRAHFPVTLDFEGWRFMSFPLRARPGVVPDRHPAPRDPPHRAEGTGRRVRGVHSGRAGAARTRRDRGPDGTPRRANPPAAPVARAGPLRHHRRAGSGDRLARRDAGGARGRARRRPPDPAPRRQPAGGLGRRGRRVRGRPPRADLSDLAGGRVAGGGRDPGRAPGYPVAATEVPPCPVPLVAAPPCSRCSCSRPRGPRRRRPAVASRGSRSSPRPSPGRRRSRRSS